MEKGLKQSDNLIKKSFTFLITGIYTVACCILFYRQAAWADGLYYESDLPAHLKMAEDGWGYSLTAFVYRIFMHLPAYKFLVAAFLALCAGGTMLVTILVLRNFCFNYYSALCAGVAVNIVMPVFIKAVHYQRYVGYQSPSVWHNSTYTVMKFLAALTLLFYLRFAYEYKRKINWKYWILFTLFLTLSTAAKTSFLLVFAPVAFVGLFFDIRRKVPIGRVLLFASAILPSVVIVLLQEMVLFGKDTGNGIVIEFGYNVYLRAERPQLTMILSALFPVLVFLFNIVPVVKETVTDLKKKYFPRHTPFFLAWSMWFVGALELLFLKETGERALDGNFSWGYDFCLFVLFVVSVVYFMNNLRSARFLGGKYPAHIAYAVVMGTVLGYHLFCGFYFFINLLKGVTYFMQ